MILKQIVHPWERKNAPLAQCQEDVYARFHLNFRRAHATPTQGVARTVRTPEIKNALLDP